MSGRAHMHVHVLMRTGMRVCRVCSCMCVCAHACMYTHVHMRDVCERCVCGMCVWDVCVGCMCGMCVWDVCVGCVCGMCWCWRDLQHSADVNCSATAAGERPLQLVLQHSPAPDEMVRLLLQHRADVALKDDGGTQCQPNTQSRTKLVRHGYGAQWRVAHNSGVAGNSSLLTAVLTSATADVVQLIVDAAPRLDDTNQHGQSLLELAVQAAQVQGLTCPPSP